MTYNSFFEIGGDLIELHSDYQYETGQIDFKTRKQRKAVSKDVKSVGRSMKRDVRSAPKGARTSSDDGWGPAESVGYGLGILAGTTFAIATFPVVVADSPMIGPADIAWFAASARFMNRSTNIGRGAGQYVDDKMGWD